MAEFGVSPTWRDAADKRGSRVALRRLNKRSSAGAGFLVLPAVVMGVLCGAFLIWFLMGAPEFTATPWKDSPEAPVRAPVQAPQMAYTSPMPPLRTSSAAPEPAPAPATALQTQAPVTPAPALPSEDSMALALQPTTQLSTPAAMRSVMSEPQQISASEQEARPPVAPQAAKRVTPPPAPPQQAPVAAILQPPKATAPPAAAPPDPAPPAADAEQPARRTFSIVLARVETEGEARAKLGPLKQKFGALLGGRRLNYHRVKEDGAYVWRVRSPGLSEDDATEICEKIESAGGDCTASPQ